MKQNGETISFQHSIINRPTNIFKCQQKFIKSIKNLTTIDDYYNFILAVTEE